MKESDAVVGYNSIVWMETKITLYDEKLPQEVIDIIKKANKKRSDLGW